MVQCMGNLGRPVARPISFLTNAFTALRVTYWVLKRVKAWLRVCASCVLCRAVLQVAEWLWGQVGGGEPAPALSVPMKLSQGLR
jgi:hypothetical protein